MAAITIALAAALWLGTSESDQGLDRNRPEFRQFEFWLGEWRVNNRAIQPDGSWSDDGESRARITPLFDRRLVIEQWDGNKGGRRVFGFSARAFDPWKKKWVLLLNWPGGGVPGFGTLEGSFRHGRGEFFARSPRRWTRYSFSDTLPDSIRWDSSYSSDQGRSWSTDWIMEFSRTAPISAMTEDRLFGEIDPEVLCTQPEAAQFEFLLGSWEVIREQLDQEGNVLAESELQMRAARIINACAVIELYSTEDRSYELFQVRSYIPQSPPRWNAWSIDNQDFRFASWNGSMSKGERLFQRASAPAQERVVWTEANEDFFEWERQEFLDSAWIPRERFLGMRP